MNFRNSYWIPTNRNVSACIASYILEIDYWYKLSGQAIPLFILDSGNEKIEQENSEVASAIASQYPHLSVSHISLSLQQKIIRELLKSAGLDASLVELIAPGNTNYGAVMNKIAVLAASLGSEFIHRRDSDTTLQPHCPSPLEFEILALDRVRKPGISPVAVGSGYVGEWSMDLKPFIQVNPKLFSVFWSCLGVSEDLHDAIYKKLDNESQATYNNDSINYTDKNGFFLPDAGNVALSSFYQSFPCLPSNAMSSDYSWFRFARGLGFPMIYHQRRVVHEYHQERGDNIETYLTSLLKYCDLRPIYAQLESQIETKRLTGDPELSSNPQRSIAIMLQQLAAMNTGQRMEKLYQFLDCFIGARYPEWAENAKKELPEIYQECNQDYQNHINLLLQWETIITTALTTGTNVKRLLFNKN